MKMSLPALNDDERQHSERLIRRIAEEIERSAGWISFERYMEMALYEPGLGYYSAGARKLGSEGDFVTAPEISPLFSRCIARQSAEVLGNLGGGDILELGAGSGVMAADLLGELAAINSLPHRYYILEVSADLRARQRTLVESRIPQLRERVVWLDALPENFVGMVLANEVLDAIPVQRFRMRGEQVNAVGITYRLGKLEQLEAPADAPLQQAVRAVEAAIGRLLPDGYESEINLRSPIWIGSLADMLRRGAILLIDYGLPRAQYYSADRNRGTLLCHYRHRFHSDPLVNVGLQDIGAWVDFTLVAETAVDAGLSVAGFCTQTHFLIGSGIETLLADLAHRDLPDRLHLARQTLTLTLPGEMGERFKVIGLTKAYEAAMCGFSIRDLAGTL